MRCTHCFHERGGQGGPTRTVGQAVDDVTIGTKMKTALAADPELSALKINVDTTQGNVRLRGEVKSVVGTIDVDPSDPLLLKADEAIRALFAESLARPFAVKETRAAYGRRARRRRG